MMSWRLELFQVFRVPSGVRLNSFELSLLLFLSLSLFEFVLMFSIFTLKMAQLYRNLNNKCVWGSHHLNVINLQYLPLLELERKREACECVCVCLCHEGRSIPGI